MSIINQTVSKNNILSLLVLILIFGNRVVFGFLNENTKNHDFIKNSNFYNRTLQKKIFINTPEIDEEAQWKERKNTLKNIHFLSANIFFKSYFAFHFKYIFFPKQNQKYHTRPIWLIIKNLRL